jgi:hypothetical protein
MNIRTPKQLQKAKKTSDLCIKTLLLNAGYETTFGTMIWDKLIKRHGSALAE